ncbi:MAG: hypothetical protein RJB38_2123 [Pseudomonadota bacterium]|jgi:exopolyphosphatase/guanosine-5'-triphosphate,3'-diphosphate pyrophosphatase
MRFGIIDLGTNSVRFDVHQVNTLGKSKLLHREKLMVRLGQGVFLKGKLSLEARRRTVQAFMSFAKTCEELSVQRVQAFGTSALREALDGAVLLDEIREKSGIDVRVISGAEEARLIARGVLAYERLPRGKFALVDIGGGSTEISICQGRKILFSESFPVGTARLQQVFLKSSPPVPHGQPDPVEELRRYLRALLSAKARQEKWPRVDEVLGSSGTIKSLYRMMRKAGSTKRPLAKGIHRLSEQMREKTTLQLLAMPGVEAKRVDMILAGTVLFDECLRVLRAKRFRFTPYALRDGILDEEREISVSHRSSHLGLHLDELHAKALRCGVHEGHLQSVRTMALQLFDRLKSIHRLSSEWRPFLEAAAILHDIGEVVNPAHHGKHSHYVVKNLEIAGIEPWEMDFLAQLCLWHAGGEPDLGKRRGRKVKSKSQVFPLFEAKEYAHQKSEERALFKNKERVDAFLKLLALLRIADALDRSHKATPALRSVQCRRGVIRLFLDPRKSSDLEVLRVEQKKGLFERTMGRSLEVLRRVPR